VRSTGKRASFDRIKKIKEETLENKENKKKRGATLFSCAAFGCTLRKAFRFKN
jgi:hypothetical protein